MVDVYLAIICFCAGVAVTCILRRYGMELKTDGAQLSDVPKAISGGLEDYRTVMESIEKFIDSSDSVIDDVTVNDSDTVASVKEMNNAIKETLKTIKTFK